ncbi:hypothetical protein QAD02_018448 [Eretmocerus hayati]|uniref:Uncharacterized protein n=1 Tax=Eretmocerus hayati TaxID=131215 RepID=A0ACC2PGT6_9HYME|nr:hypothetical protein QAD02_018448 [Eretmocerus hayati]
MSVLILENTSFDSDLGLSSISFVMRRRGASKQSAPRKSQRTGTENERNRAAQGEEEPAESDGEFEVPAAQHNQQQAPGRPPVRADHQARGRPPVQADHQAAVLKDEYDEPQFQGADLQPRPRARGPQTQRPARRRASSPGGEIPARQRRGRPPIATDNDAAQQRPGVTLSHPLPAPLRRARGRPRAAIQHDTQAANQIKEIQPPAPRQRRGRGRDNTPAPEPELPVQQLQPAQEHHQQGQDEYEFVHENDIGEHHILPPRRRARQRQREEAAAQPQQDGRGERYEPEIALTPPRQRRSRRDYIDEPDHEALELLQPPSPRPCLGRRARSAATPGQHVQLPFSLPRRERHGNAAFSPEQRAQLPPPRPRRERRGDHAPLREHQGRPTLAPTQQQSSLQAPAARRAMSHPQNHQNQRPAATTTSTAADRQVEYRNFSQQNFHDDEFGYSSDDSEFDDMQDPSDPPITSYPQANFINFPRPNQFPAAHNWRIY